MGYKANQIGNPERDREKRVAAQKRRDEKNRKKAQDTLNNTGHKPGAADGPGNKPTTGRGYIERFNGRLVKVNLANGEILTGKLHTDPYNKYEYLLEEEQFGTMVIKKEAVAYIRFKEA